MWAEVRSPAGRIGLARHERNAMSETRIEKDSLGEMQVPAAALWGPQTQRAVENFPISGRPLPPAFVHTLGLIKAAAARVNQNLGLLEAPVAKAIETAAIEVA